MEWEYQFAGELVKSRPINIVKTTKFATTAHVHYGCFLYHVLICCSILFVLPAPALYHLNMMLHFSFYICAHTITH